MTSHSESAGPCCSGAPGSCTVAARTPTHPDVSRVSHSSLLNRIIKINKQKASFGVLCEKVDIRSQTLHYKPAIPGRRKYPIQLG